jgi:hypothetical protein
MRYGQAGQDEDRQPSPRAELHRREITVRADAAVLAAYGAPMRRGWGRSISRSHPSFSGQFSPDAENTSDVECRMPVAAWLPCRS